MKKMFVFFSILVFAIAMTVCASAAGYDFIVESISWTPEFPEEGDEVIFSAVVKNIGDEPSDEGIGIGLRFDVGKLGKAVSWNSSYSLSIAPGESVTVTAETGPNGVDFWECGDEYNYLIYAFVDDIKRFPNEVTRENNVFYTTLHANKSTAPEGAHVILAPADFEDVKITEGDEPIWILNTAEKVEYYANSATNGVSYSFDEDCQAMKVIVRGNDPFIVHNFTENDVFDCTEYPYLKIVFQAYSDNAKLAELHFANETTALTGSTRMTFLMDGEGDMEEAIVYMGGNGLWNGNIQDFRYDLVQSDEGYNDETFYIYSIGFFKTEDEAYTYKTPAQLATMTDKEKAPDLIINSVSLSPETPVEGDEVIFTATIKNQGISAIEEGTEITVNFGIGSSDNIVATATYTGGIGVNESVEIAITEPWSCSSETSLKIYSVVTSTLELEANPNNNTNTKNVKTGNTETTVTPDSSAEPETSDSTHVDSDSATESVEVSSSDNTSDTVSDSSSNAITLEENPDDNSPTTLVIIIVAAVIVIGVIIGIIVSKKKK